MLLTDIWMAGGDVVVAPSFKNLSEERLFLQASSLIKIELRATGTHVRWSQFAPNWVSLTKLCYMVSQFPAPITLHYFNAGWFTEKYAKHFDATSRVERLMASSDVRLSTRTYIETISSNPGSLPAKLRDAWAKGIAPHDQAIVCALNFEQERANVSFVGTKSDLATVWGLSPAAFPRQTGHSYDKTVSQNYFSVIRNDQPVHDHVLAAMTFPEGDIRWLAYQRLIFPSGVDERGRPTVNVLTELAPVDIRLM
jgi:hypothetical protein